MKNIEILQALNKIKLLADSRRLEILRLVMAGPATLTQLARKLNQSPAWIRHHIKTLEEAELVEMIEIRTTGRVTEKYYRAKSEAFLLQELILPKTKVPTIIFSGSHDLAIEEVAKRLAKHILVLLLPVGSLDGLVNLRQGLCQVSGAHLLDESGEYNKAFVHRIFPDREMELITLAHRTQGLMVSPGNPKKTNWSVRSKPLLPLLSSTQYPAPGRKMPILFTPFPFQFPTIGMSPGTPKNDTASVVSHAPLPLLSTIQVPLRNTPI